MNAFWDRLGISASIFCIVHCLFTPLLVVMVPFVGQTLAHGWFHVGIAALVIPLAVWALWNGYRQHRTRRILWLGGIGLVFVALALFAGAETQWVEVALMSTGGVLLALAHLGNLRACQISHK